MDDRIEVSAETVAALVAEQFPQWAHLPVTPVEHSGWDNRSFRLGETMLVRLPSAMHYVAQVQKEQRWLPYLAARLPLPIPEPLALGQPGQGFPWNWSIYRWLDGTPLALTLHQTDLDLLARDVAGFLTALQAVDASNGPAAGSHNFHRGGSLSVYSDETEASIIALSDEIDVDVARDIWAKAIASKWQGAPVWVHGDIAEGNLLMENGRLAAVIDFGSSAVGDPSTDLILAWTVLDKDSRRVFRDLLPLDSQTWQRARGWALWKALITLAAQRSNETLLAKWSHRTIREVFSDHLENS
ncbi:aminoglycoside phosphotransferase family protein [Agrobacterium rubi]|uniref:aminoglycoside phosphotransferase family protein n=1 Tax=Agrobacterium rubi TaxID=28099 RepID=UPI001572409A|nr:aminoglycoside phosphotransferase family protein [Agrobacterium rubi]NTF07888.1 aminoglycoside phosphotransferase family protein [Agrobacterium rubi]NTF20132.1 aminoglycoside phosphotransferase family protein [Agrobacterium rubi]NTF27103.1 aminoglycoside phosphotransferase family protein [Agrobacterium rubi]